MKNLTLKIALFAAFFAVTACGGTETESECSAGAQQCVGEQIQTCGDDGTWGAAQDCAAGQACSEGHEGMDYVHCMDETGHTDDGHTDDGHDEEHGAEEACEHMAGEDASALTAGADSASATETSHEDWEHKRVDITLNAVDGGGFEGYVTYEAEVDGDFAFYASTEVTIAIENATAEGTMMVDECTDVAQMTTFELSVGEYIVHLVSASETVSLVVEAGGHEGEDGH